MFRYSEAISGYILLMPRKPSKRSERKPRTDAQRNRERILEVAKAAFTRSGADASLDDIAKQVGVGPGTLYRHFPTRDALIEAVYHTEVENWRQHKGNYPQNCLRSRRCGPG
jgi:AcrR family transcriptional regulator